VLEVVGGNNLQQYDYKKDAERNNLFGLYLRVVLYCDGGDNRGYHTSFTDSVSGRFKHGIYHIYSRMI
jgi:hypothetical protein